MHDSLVKTVLEGQLPEKKHKRNVSKLGIGNK